MSAPKLADVSSPRGAPMGRLHRPNWTTEGFDPATFTGRLYLRRVRLNGGGYDDGGAYWGHGAPLYWAHGEDDNPGPEDGGVDIWCRAQDREHAKDKVRERLPLARFYR